VSAATTAPPMRWARIEDIREGAEAVVRERITETLVQATAEVTGDWNPLHVDASAARELGESRPVGHGIILLGIVSRLIGMQLPGPGSLWFANAVQFLAPVRPGDEVEVRVRVTRVSVATNVVVLEVTAHRLPDTPVLRGTATVRVASPVAHQDRAMKESEQTVLVTGASRGVGRVIAATLATLGMRVAINYRADERGAREAAEAIADAGGVAQAVAGDVATAEGVGRAYDETMRAFGRLDVIVHNATPAIVAKPYLETTAADYRCFFETYVVGLHELVLRAAPQMRERRHGRIIAILSSSTAEVPSKFAAYIAGKQALFGFCRALAVELGPLGITVNMVSPSMLVGPRTDDLGVGGREILARKTPLRRLGSAEDVARTVAFLAGRDASFLSGANIPVTGGILF